MVVRTEEIMRKLNKANKDLKEYLEINQGFENYLQRLSPTEAKMTTENKSYID